MRPTLAGMTTFTVDEARALLRTLEPEVDELIRLRADLVDATHAHRTGDADVPLADVKAMEARVSEIVDGITARGVQVKGWAPLLLDFPMTVDDREVLLCWVEGEAELTWYHELAHGFAGRRPLSDLPEAG